jgi:hypothetical protein
MLRSEALRIIADLGASLNAIQNSALELRARVSIKERLAAANMTMEPAMLDFVVIYLRDVNRELKNTIKEKLNHEDETET